MPTAAISAQEQLMMELINRARLDPWGEAARFGIGLNDGLAAGTITGTPKAPLAFDVDLNESASGHSSWMLAADVFSHTGSGGSSSNERMKAAGYVFTGGWASGENISWRGTTGTINVTDSIYAQHQSLFLSAGHRKNTMGDYRELGIAQEIGQFTKSGTTYNASMITQNFAKTGTQAFITGVSYNDADKDRFYDIGEGRSGIVIDWLGNSGGAVSTAAAGGYAVAIPTGMGGSAAVAVTVGATTIQASLAMTGTNVKLDVIDGRILAASTSMTLGQNAVEGKLLGAANLTLVGNNGANSLIGNNASNILKGLDGADYINACDGHDTILGGAGNDYILGGYGNDTLVGGAGLDTLIGGSGSDDFVFLGTSDSGATLATADIVIGFAKAFDDIDVSAIDAHTALAGNQAFVLDTNNSFSAGEIRQKITSSGLLLEFNTDSDSAPEMAILLRGVMSALAASDFIL